MRGIASLMLLLALVTNARPPAVGTFPAHSVRTNATAAPYRRLELRSGCGAPAKSTPPTRQRKAAQRVYT